MPLHPPRAAAVGLALALASSAGCGGADPNPTTAPTPSASAMPVPSQALDVERAKLATANPKGVALHVDTVDKRHRFALGEPITLSLSFTSSVPDAYELDMGTYDRSGRLWSESFRFEPPDQVADPLADFFGDMKGGLGGIRPMPKKLSTEPVDVEVVLNEWARFAGPGRYRFYVKSTRVFVTREVSGVRTIVDQPVTSDGALELEIVSDPAWAAKELARVTAVLDKGGDEETMTAARRSLRFLTTSDAARAQVDDLCRTRRTGDDYRFQTQAGLYGAPDRTLVIELLRKALARPDCAISTEILELLTRLELVQKRGHPRSPEAAEAVRTSILQALIAGLPSKSDEARPLSVLTALAAISASTQGKGPPSPDADALKKTLAKHLGALPDDALADLLGRSWPLVRSPAVAPALKALAEEARPRGGRMQSISDLALARLVEVDYDAARAFILAELERGPRLSFTGATLGLLKDKELPQLDAALVRGILALDSDGATLELKAEVFARYASNKNVKEAWQSYKAIDYFRVALLAYLSRTDPRAADAEVKKLGIDSLFRLSKMTWTPAVEAAVVGYLGKNIDAAQAAGLLAEHGSKSAERALSARLDALRGDKKAKDAASAIRRALTHGSAWMTPPKRLRELLGRCDDEECRRDVQSMLDRWGKDGTHPAFVLWTTQPEESTTGWLGHYDLRSAADVETRIGQLPDGTTLDWQTKPEDVAPALWANVEKWAAAKKVVIAPAKNR